MSAEKEGRVERYLVRRCRDIRGDALKFESPGSSGVPDRVCYAPGLPTVFVECKAPGQRLRPLQKAVHDDMAKRGALVFTVSNEAQVEDFINWWLQQ